MTATNLVPTLPLEPYVASDTLKAGISAAGSRRYNQPSFERLWHVPWRETLNDLLRYAEPNIQVYSEHPIYLPREQMQDIDARKQFKSAGVDWAATDDQIRTILIPPVPASVSAEQADTMTRVQTNERKRAEKVRAEAEKKAERLISLRKVILGHIGKYPMIQVFPSHLTLDIVTDPGDISLADIESIHEDEAAVKQSDIAALHLVSSKVNRPKGYKEGRHWDECGGRKTWHCCLLSLIELKRLPKRSLDKQNHEKMRGRVLQAAKKQAVENCARYFKHQPNASSVMVVIASGPYWRCTMMSASQTAWDFVADEIIPQNVPRFSRLYVLGTPASDQKLDVMRRSEIHKEITRHGHLPPTPPNIEDSSSSDPDEFANSELDEESE